MNGPNAVESWIRAVAQERFDRSSGPGGQNVNKVNSKVTLVLPMEDWPFGDDEILAERLGSRINANGDLVVQCDETRSQLKNREIAVKRAVAILEANRRRPKKRRATKPSRAAKERRLEEKKRRSSLKRDRNWRE